MDLSFKHYGEAGRDILCTQPDFDFFNFERIKDDMMLLEGSLFKTITKGKNKGDVRWLPEGRIKTVLTSDEVITWCKKYEQESGNCAQCFGKGKVMKSWSAKEGTKYKPCEICGGTGDANDNTKTENS